MKVVQSFERLFYAVREWLERLFDEYAIILVYEQHIHWRQNIRGTVPFCI